MLGFQFNFGLEVSLNENAFDFSVDYTYVDESDILNIYKYLMTKTNKK